MSWASQPVGPTAGSQISLATTLRATSARGVSPEPGRRSAQRRPGRRQAEETSNLAPRASEPGGSNSELEPRSSSPEPRRRQARSSRPRSLEGNLGRAGRRRPSSDSGRPPRAALCCPRRATMGTRNSRWLVGWLLLLSVCAQTRAAPIWPRPGRRAAGREAGAERRFGDRRIWRIGQLRRRRSWGRRGAGARLAAALGLASASRARAAGRCSHYAPAAIWAAPQRPARSATRAAGLARESLPGAGSLGPAPEPGAGAWAGVEAEAGAGSLALRRSQGWSGGKSAPKVAVAVALGRLLWAWRRSGSAGAGPAPALLLRCAASPARRRRPAREWGRRRARLGSPPAANPIRLADG